MLNSNKNTYSEGMLKGRMAETIIEEMLMSCGNKVYRFGYEAIVQNLVQIEGHFDVNSEVALKIRTIPDFIIVDKKGNTSFLEVKFRWDGKLKETDIQRIKKIEKFWDSPIIFVCCYKKPYFRMSYPPYIDKKNELLFKPLNEIISLDVNVNKIEKYEELVEKYLTPTLWKKK